MKNSRKPAASGPFAAACPRDSCNSSRVDLPGTTPLTAVGSKWCGRFGCGCSSDFQRRGSAIIGRFWRFGRGVAFGPIRWPLRQRAFRPASCRPRACLRLRAERLAFRRPASLRDCCRLRWRAAGELRRPKPQVRRRDHRLDSPRIDDSALSRERQRSGVGPRRQSRRRPSARSSRAVRAKQVHGLKPIIGSS